MNQAVIGKYIAHKRKQRNLTQEQLAEKLGVTNKAVSKWECGKCMPDYSMTQPLCKELGITVSELIEGQDRMQADTPARDDRQVLDMLRRIQELERQKQSMLGMILTVMGIALLALSKSVSGSSFRDFISGLMLGLSVGEMLAGCYVIGRSFAKQD